MLRLNLENEITIIDGTTLCKAKKLGTVNSANLFELDETFLFRVCPKTIRFYQNLWGSV